MTSRTVPSQDYLRLLDALHSDISDVPVEGSAASFDRDRLFQKMEVRAGKMRFAAAKNAMKNQPVVSAPIIPAELMARARELLANLANRNPSFTEKYSMAFRHGKDLPDQEIEAILKDLIALGVKLDPENDE